MVRRLTFAFLLGGALLDAQNATPDEPPLKLERIVQFISLLPDPVNLFEAIPRNGIDFQVDETSLSSILEGARKGKQSDAFTARLIAELLRACVGCREHYYGPLNMEGLLSLIGRSLPPQLLIEEVRLRGTDHIPKTQESIDHLHGANAPADLISLIIPEHEIEIPTPPGYMRLDLRRSSSFSTTAEVGRLELVLDISGKVELLFVNNALFAKPLDDGKPDAKTPAATIKDLACSYTAPGPLADVKFDLESLDRQEVNRGKMVSILKAPAGKILGNKPPAKVDLESNLVGQRRGFRITIDEPDRKQPHNYKLTLQWERPPAR